MGMRDRVVSVRAVATLVVSVSAAATLRERGILESWLAAREGPVVTAAMNGLPSVLL